MPPDPNLDAPDPNLDAIKSAYATASADEKIEIHHMWCLHFLYSRRHRIQPGQFEDLHIAIHEVYRLSTFSAALGRLVEHARRELNITRKSHSSVIEYDNVLITYHAEIINLGRKAFDRLRTLMLLLDPEGSRP